jgi:hypothetical protein
MTKAAESLIAQLHSQGKLTTPRHKNKKNWHEIKILKANEHTMHVNKLQIYWMTPKKTTTKSCETIPLKGGGQSTCFPWEGTQRKLSILNEVVYMDLINLVLTISAAPTTNQEPNITLTHTKCGKFSEKNKFPAIKLYSSSSPNHWSPHLSRKNSHFSVEFEE